LTWQLVGRLLVLRAQEPGIERDRAPVPGDAVTFNLVNIPALDAGRSLSDRVGRRRVIVVGWADLCAIYLGFAVARTGCRSGFVNALYGAYYA